jgi:hypothetical protein
LKKLSLLALVFAGSLAAAGTVSVNDVINPVGDETMGMLNVQIPKLSMLPSTVSSGSGNLATDQMVRVKAGTYPLTLSYSGHYVSHVNAVVVQKQTTVIRPAAVRFTWDANALAANVGPKPALTFKASDNSVIESITADRSWLWDHPTFQYAPLFPDTVTVSSVEVPALGAQQITLPDGATVDQAIKFRDLRATVDLIPPTSVFPDFTAVGTTFSKGPDVYMVWRTQMNPNANFHVPVNVYNSSIGGYDYSGTTGLNNFYAGSSSSSNALMFYPSADGATNLVYDLVVNNTWTQVTAKPGEHIKIQLKRLDVNDVQVTRENGTTYMAPGTYFISYQVVDAATGNTKWVPLQTPALAYGSTSTYSIAGSFPTKSGVTVLPNVYKVRVNYNTEEGSKQTEQIVDLR